MKKIILLTLVCMIAILPVTSFAENIPSITMDDLIQLTDITEGINDNNKIVQIELTETAKAILSDVENSSVKNVFDPEGKYNLDGDLEGMVSLDVPDDVIDRKLILSEYGRDFTNENTITAMLGLTVENTTTWLLAETNIENNQIVVVIPQEYVEAAKAAEAVTLAFFIK